MIIDASLIDRLEILAKESPRLRAGYDLRTSPADGSQRMLNSLQPGTIVPIHRHKKSAETMIVIRGEITELFYDDGGKVTGRYFLKAGSDHIGIQIPIGQWHTVKVSSPVTIVEIKDGPYEPLDKEDVLEVSPLTP